MSDLSVDEQVRLTDLYCQRAAEEWTYLRESGAEIALSDVYVMLEAVKEAPHEALDKSSDLIPIAERLEHAGIPMDVIPGEKLSVLPVPLETALRENRRLILLGEPGSGKSTILQYIGLCYAQRSALITLNLDETHIPVLIPLGGYAEKIVQSNEGFIGVLEEAVIDFLPLDEKPQAGDLLKSWNREGNLLVLLDGLDEVPERLRSKVFDKIRSLHRSLREPCRIVTTSRRVGYVTIGTPYKEFNLKPLEDKEARIYLVRWLRALKSDWDESRTNKEAKNLIEQMKAQPSLRRLMDNPQILKLSARNYAQSGGNLATNRAELYEQYIHSSFASRETPFSLDKLMDMLEDLAWGLYTEQVPNISKEENNQIRQSTGLIVQVGKRLTFAHLTLQEYFAARRLAMAWGKNPDWTWRFIKPRLHLPEWHEPLLLLAGTLKENGGKDLVHRVLKAGSAVERRLPRDLRMAVEMTAENQRIPTQIVLQTSRKLMKQHFWDTERNFITKRVIFSFLGIIGEAALPELREALDDPDIVVRWYAVKALGKMGKAALPELRDALKNPDQNVRWVAAETLGEIGEAALPAVPELLEVLDDLDERVSQAAEKALGEMGEAALSELREAQWNRDEYESWVTTDAPEKVDEATLTELRKALKDSNELVRIDAAITLEGLGKASLPALPDILDALKDPEEWVWEAAARALGKFGKAALPELREVLKDPDADLHWRALNALGEMGEAALPELREILKVKDPDADARRLAATALGEMGKAALPALPELREALEDPDEWVREAAAEALGEMGEAALPVLPELREALKDPDEGVRKATAAALEKIGEGASPALPELLEALEDPDEEVCWVAAISITKILAKTSYIDNLPQQQNLDRLLRRLTSILSGKNYKGFDITWLSTALQIQESLRLKNDPYRDPLQPPPVSQLERLASFAGTFLFFIIVLAVISILGVFSGSAGKVLGDQATKYFTTWETNHPFWMLIALVGLLAAAVALANFFLVDQIKERLKRWHIR